MPTTTEVRGMIADAALPTAHRLVEATTTYDLGVASAEIELEVEDVVWKTRVMVDREDGVVHIRATAQTVSEGRWREPLPADPPRRYPPILHAFGFGTGEREPQLVWTLPIGWLPSSDPGSM